VGGLRAGCYGGDGAAEHDGEDPCGGHWLESQRFTCEQEMILEYCCAEGDGHIHPEEDAEACDEPGAV